ncbi:MAG TPA: hypothetical protein VF017_02675 [Thermoanaerobaculia bacterium]|nr:hypothetical protein [Thermoanaerobaculia bacterium]
MSELAIHPKIREALRLNQESILRPEVVQNQGAGMAYQVVAQTTAFAVQDATDYLRNVSLVGATTIAAAVARMMEGGHPGPWPGVIEAAQKAVDHAAETFRAVGVVAGEVLRRFPPAEPVESTEAGDE